MSKMGEVEHTMSERVQLRRTSHRHIIIKGREIPVITGLIGTEMWKKNYKKFLGIQHEISPDL